MVVEMLVLAVLAIVIFAFVLAPIVRPERPDDTVPVDESEAVTEERREPVGTDGQPVRDTP